MIGLSFIGTGDYKEITYKFGEKTCKTNLMPLAIKEFFQIETLFVIQTEEAKQRHGNTLQDHCPYTPIDIPSGKNSNELWQMFSKIAEAIPENATLVVDITHGFRSQPMIALSIMMYLQAAKNIKVEKIVYGAFEARENDIAPVFDLTPFLDIMNWASATKQLLEFGDAKLMKSLLNNAQRENRMTGINTNHLKNLGDDLAKLTDALVTTRPQESINFAEKLITRLKAVQNDLNAPNAQPLKPLIQKIEKRFEKMVVPDNALFSEKGFEAQSEMIDFYLQTENYPQAITLARESVVSKKCKLHQLSDYIKERSKAEEHLNKLAEELRKQSTNLEESERKIAIMWNDITNYRNDINHAGMRQDPLSSSKLIENIQKTCEQAKKFLLEN